MKKIMIAASVLLILLAFVSCNNDNKSLDGEVATTVAGELKPRDLVEKVLRDGDKDGLDISYDLKEVEKGAKPSYTHTLSVTVVFSGYEYSRVLTIDRGRLTYTFYGTMAGTRFTSGSYELRTEEAMAVSGTSEGTVDVELSIDAREGASGTSYGVTLTTDEEGKTVAEGTPSVSVTIPDDAVLSVGGTETTIPEEEPEYTPPSNPYGFAGGTGTESDPYLIANANQFLQIGSTEFQEKLLEGENDDLYFRLTGDIDLSNHSGYAARVISGTLDGDNHTIRCSNDMPYLFEYFFEDTTFRNFTIEFGDSSVTRMFTYPAVRAIYEGNYKTVTEPGKDPTTTYFYKYDNDVMNLIFDNVDFITPNDNTYTVADNNFAFYISNVGAFDVFVESESPLSADSKVEYSALGYMYLGDYVEDSYERLTFNVSLQDCDVKGNFIGGFGGSGAAIFLGGQFLGAQVSMDNCHFSGNLEGLNVALAVANWSGCGADYGSSITATDVTVEDGGKITSYSGKGGLYYSNSTDKIDGVSGTFVGPSPDNFAINVTNAKQNSLISISGMEGAEVEEYQVKLFLPSMYWYKTESDTSYITRTDSNTFTINVGADELDPSGIYAAKVLSSIEADHLKDTISEFASIEYDGTSEEGFRYAFVQHEEQWYMMIDYGNLIRMYSDAGLPNDISIFRYPLRVIVLAKDTSGEVIGFSELTNITG